MFIVVLVVVVVLVVIVAVSVKCPCCFVRVLQLADRDGLVNFNVFQCTH